MITIAIYENGEVNYYTVPADVDLAHLWEYVIKDNCKAAG